MSFHRWCFLIAALVYTTAAWFGVGYHAEDEFQHVILFAEHMRGHVDAASMPLDFHAHWRSMALPLIAAGVFETCEAVGVTDPFLLTFVLRLLTAALALWVTHGFIRSVRPLVRPENEQAFVLLNLFLWFVPILQIRFTGEAWSGLLLLRGLGLMMDQRGSRALAIGACFGAAIVLRPALVAMPLGAMLWLIIVQRTPRPRLLGIAAGAIAAIVLGTIIDGLAYGSPTFTLWNYGLSAITGEEAGRFSILPWYQHALFIVKHAAAPIGALLLVAFAVLVALRPKHVLVWVIAPVLILLSIVPVKEVRFLFPLAPLAPWMLIAAWDELQLRWPRTMARTFWLQVLFPFAVVNVLALVVAAITPAGNGKIKLAQAAAERFGNEAVQIDQMADWRPWIPPFFLAPGSTEEFTQKIVVDPENKPNHLVVAQRSLGFDRIANLERMAVVTPAWADHLLDWYRLEDAHDPLVIYRITTQRIGH